MPRIAAPRGNEPRSRITPIAKGAALRALAPSTIFQAPDGGAPAFNVLSSVARSVPCYELQLGQDMGDVPDLIKSLLTDNAVESDLRLVQRREHELIRECWRSPEHHRAVDAFLARSR